jgi:hypothetical protein
MHITGIDCSSVLIPLIEDSFASQIPRNIISGNVMTRLTDDVLKSGSVVTYGEMISEMLFFYSMLRFKLPDLKIVILQHSLLFENKMQMIMFPDFFTPRNGNRFEAVQGPDLYLLQGEQAKRIVSKFLPEEKIRVIGCLKNKNVAIEKRKSGERAITNVVVALSLGDEFYVINCIRDLIDLPDIKWSICFHPAVSNYTRNECTQIIGLNHVSVDFFSGKTREKIDDADVVISGYSAVGIEALQYGLDTIRIVDPGFPPTIDNDSRIPCVASVAELANLLDLVRRGQDLIKEKESIVYDYFFLQDDRESERLWDVINGLNQTRYPV